MANKKRGFNKYEIRGNVTAIFLEDNKKNIVAEAIIDTEDLNNLIRLDYRWYRGWSWNKTAYYPTATEYYYDEKKNRKSKVHRLHNVIMKSEGKYEVKIDHIDNDTYNNTKENLRKSNNASNSKNRSRKNSNNTSGYRNVSFIGGYWRIQLQVNGKNKLFPEKFEDVK